MYELIVDCGTCIDRHELESEEAVRNFMCEHEPYYRGSTEELLDKGITNCGIDTITLEKIYDTYEICEGSLLKRKDEKVDNYYACVKGICINEFGGVEINTQECWFYQGKLCYDYECYGDSSVEEIYKHYILVGEDFKLFGGG